MLSASGLIFAQSTAAASCPFVISLGLKLWRVTSLALWEQKSRRKKNPYNLSDVLAKKHSVFFFFGEFIGSINTFSSSNINLSPSIDRSQPHLQTWLWPAVPSVSSPVCIWWLLRSASSFTDFVCVCVNRKLRSSLYDWKTVKIIHGLLWHCFDSHRSIDSDSLKSFIYWSPHAISH